MTRSRGAIGLLGLVIALGCGSDGRKSDSIGDATPTVPSLAAAPGRQAASTPRASGPAPGWSAGKQILFGDLHVHTTYSIDAFVFSLPLFGGEGAHPPDDACDFARYCAGVDFFSLNDHAESLTPEQWTATKESVRACNARAGDPANPDLVAFVGWEWTQTGATPAEHYGHKNVILRGLRDDELPARPITALSDDVFRQTPNRTMLRGLQLLGPLGLRPYAEFLARIERLADLPNCEHGVDTRRLPPSCRENAPTPEELFEKLAQWGGDALVIPHGLTWGIHAPLGARLDNQLTATRHDPDRERLLEIFSGHGSGELYRRWAEPQTDADGTVTCPAPTREFLPCCWRAGEIMRARCQDLPAKECDARVAAAQRLTLESSLAPHLVFPDTTLEDWLDCDQCRDCFKPAFAPRAGESAQYSAAITNLDERDASGRPLRYRWGFVASSDDHKARPGTGYKQVARRVMTDTNGFAGPWYEWALRARINGTQTDPQQPQAGARSQQSFAGLLDIERVSSFMYPGGLVAAHATGRGREAIWEALERREVYGTSGPRILLWFDLLNGPEGRVPMGSAVEVADDPQFAVRAVGAFAQQPGCPAESVQGLTAERLAQLCGGECHHPGDERQRIAAIEVVRIRPRVRPGEDIGALIEDPWRHFDCPPSPDGCEVAFDDPDYVRSGRDTVYYVRALQEETPAINGANFRTEFDREGRPTRISPCYGGYRTPADDDCLAPVRERAWSSPIFVDRPLPSR